MSLSDSLSHRGPLGTVGLLGGPRQGPIEGAPKGPPPGVPMEEPPEGPLKGAPAEGAPEGPPPWQWPEAVSFVLQQQLGVSPSAFACSTASASSILSALRFIGRLLQLLLESGGPPDASVRKGEGGPRGPPGLPPVPADLLSPRIRKALERCCSCMQAADGALWIELEQLETEETPSCHRLAAFLTTITAK